MSSFLLFLKNKKFCKIKVSVSIAQTPYYYFQQFKDREEKQRKVGEKQINRAKQSEKVDQGKERKKERKKGERETENLEVVVVNKEKTDIQRQTN